MALGLSLAGCGGGSALDGLSDGQRDALDAAWTARISATDTADITPEARDVRAKALYAACRPLDKTQPLLAAVAALCGPTASSQKLGVLLPVRCATPSAICKRALNRLASASEDEAARLVAVNAAAKAAVEDPGCLAELTTTEPQLAGYSDLKAAYTILAAGIDRDDRDFVALGQRRIDDAKAVIAPRGTIAQRTAQFRTKCIGET